MDSGGQVLVLCLVNFRSFPCNMIIDHQRDHQRNHRQAHHRDHQDLSSWWDIIILLSNVELIAIYSDIFAVQFKSFSKFALAWCLVYLDAHDILGL